MILCVWYMESQFNSAGSKRSGWSCVLLVAPTILSFHLILPLNFLLVTTHNVLLASLISNHLDKNAIFITAIFYGSLRLKYYKLKKESCQNNRSVKHTVYDLKCNNHRFTILYHYCSVHTKTLLTCRFLLSDVLTTLFPLLYPDFVKRAFHLMAFVVAS